MNASKSISPALLSNSFKTAIFDFSNFVILFESEAVMNMFKCFEPR